MGLSGLDASQIRRFVDTEDAKGLSANNRIRAVPDSPLRVDRVFCADERLGPISERFASLSPHLDERGRRLFAASEARSAGYGGIATVSRITGIAASTIGRGLRELAANIAPGAGRLRRPGGGRKPLVATDPGLLPALLALVEPMQRGDPMSALRWTCKSLRRLAAELTAQGHPVSRTVVGELLAQQNFSLQANSKTREGGDHPDRDAQFLHIDQSVTEALAAKQPVISVDTKKKELVGDFKNAGREWRPKGEPEAVRVHDFLIKELGRAVPYGIYDIAGNAGWVSVGMDHDTASSLCRPSAAGGMTMGRIAIRRQAPGDHRGLRWQQWLTGSVVETRTATPGRRTRHQHHGPPSAARHQQMEQDRCVTNTPSEKGGVELYERWG